MRLGMKLQPVPTDVQALINNCLEALEPLAEAKGYKVSNCDRAPDKVQTDPLRLQQIVTNLVSNAIRYTKTGSIKMICEQPMTSGRSPLAIPYWN